MDEVLIKACNLAGRMRAGFQAFLAPCFDDFERVNQRREKGPGEWVQGNKRAPRGACLWRSLESSHENAQCLEVTGKH